MGRILPEIAQKDVGVREEALSPEARQRVREIRERVDKTALMTPLVTRAIRTITRLDKGHAVKMVEALRSGDRPSLISREVERSVEEVRTWRK